MTRDELENAVTRAIIACLADRVVEALRTRQKCAVVLLTGTDLGLNELATTLRTLRDDGWTLRFALTRPAHNMLGAQRLAELGLPAEPGCCKTVDTLLDGCGLVLVPTLSITVAAKVAGTIRDSLASKLLAAALERGIRVIAALDGCCPDNPKRDATIFQVTAGYKARMRANLQALKDYGIALVPAGKIAGTANSSSVLTAASRATASDVIAAPAQPEGRRERRIFSRSDAVQCREGEVRLGRDVLVTPSAADELRIRNVRLIQA